MAAKILGEMIPASKRTVRTISSCQTLGLQEGSEAETGNDHLSPMSGAATAVPPMMPIALDSDGYAGKIGTERGNSGR